MARSEVNYYELLEIYPAATQEEIENAFRSALYKYHPDHNPDRPDWAHEKTSEVVEAYKVLSDPLRRKIYNFIIFANLKKTIKEYKFGIFQMGEKKKFEEALQYFKEGVELFEQDDKSSALLKFQQAYGTYKFGEAIYNVGVIYVITNKLNEALHAFREAQQLDTENQHYGKVLERLQELMKEIDKARK
jgi:DnaJ-class molecular chaperone